MDEENNNNGFFKEQAYKAKEKLKDEGKKQAKKKLIQLIASHPMGALIVLGVIVAVIIIVVLFAGFEDIIIFDWAQDTSNAKKTAINLSLTSNETDNENTKITVSKTDDGNYNISNNYTEEELNNIKEKINQTTIDSSKFTDFEIGIIGALLDNGVDIDDYEEDELKCLPAFIKAEACTQYLDLRPNSEKQKGKNTGDYIDKYEPKIDGLDENEVPGVILVQRTNTSSTSPITLEYIEKSKFEELVDNKDENVINYFTINEKGNLVIAKWDYIRVTVKGDYPENLNEEEKVQERDEYIITDPRTDSTTEIPYIQYISKYKMPFDFLMQLLAITEDTNFCREVADVVLGSKIIINIQEEETITTTTEVRTYDVHSKEEKIIDYNIEPNLESKTDYLIEKVQDDEGNKCTTYNHETEVVTITTTNKSHTYNFEILEADTWIGHYIKSYADPKEKTSGPVTENIESIVEYQQGEETTTTDTNEIQKDKDVNEFKKNKEKEYKDKVPVPNVKVSTHTKGLFSDRTYKEIAITPKGEFSDNLSSYEFDEKEIKDEDGNITYVYDMPKSFTVTTKKTNELPFEVNFNYKLNNDYTYSLSDTNQDNVLKCNISKLLIKPYSKINLNNDKTTTTTEYISDTTPKTETHIYAKDENGNFEKFLVAYDNNKDARDMINSVDLWLFEMMEENESTINLLDIVKYLLYIYDGTNYGVTELDLSIFEPDEFITATGGGSALWNNDITKDEFISTVKNYIVPSGSGKYGTYKWGYERYFIPNAENFYDIATSYGLDPRFIFCIGIHESEFGTSAIANEKGNFFGWNANDSNPYGDASSFYDMSDGIETVCKGLKQYITPGTWQYKGIVEKGYDPTTIEGIGSLYASDPNWANAVINHMRNKFNYEPGFATNGSFLAVAKECHDYIRQNNYSYIQGTTIPADENSINGIDCSAYVTWVLYEYGYTELKGHQKTCRWFMNTSTMQKMGWTVLPATQAEAGDIVVNSHHMEIYAGDGKFYNAGSTEAIRREISNCGVGYLNDFTYAIRVTPPGGI